jgi:putative DNA primase/helicase
VLPDRVDCIRFDPKCIFKLADKSLVSLPAMVCLMTDARTAEPMAVHRTALKADGSGKSDHPGLGFAKKMLGPRRGCVIRISPDDEVLEGLGLTEGIEDALSVIASSWRPVWAAGDAGAIRDFDVLPGIEALTIFGNPDGTGFDAARACQIRWQAAGRECVIRIPPCDEEDWNDFLRRSE